MPTNKTLRRRPANKPTIFLEGGFWGCASWLVDWRVSGWGRTPKAAYQGWFDALPKAPTR